NPGVVVVLGGQLGQPAGSGVVGLVAELGSGEQGRDARFTLKGHQVRSDADGPIQDGLHLTFASPLPRSTSTARAITGGMGTPILPAFSVMDRSSFARYQKMAASMMRDWSPSTVSARWATATTRN